MIVFCEDCGKKNQLNPSDTTVLKNGRPGFKCSFCGYFSPYYFKPKENQILEKADLMFKDISSFPEILGAFLFHSQMGVLKYHMPELLKKTDLDLLGKNLTGLYVTGESFLDDVNEMILSIADKNLIVKRMGEDLFMIVAGKTKVLQPFEGDQYILVDKEANILANTMTEPEKPTKMAKTAKMASACGLKSQEIGKSNFKFLMFSTKPHISFFIFPVGKYYRGVIKKEGIDNTLLTENVLAFLKGFFYQKQGFNHIRRDQ